MFRNTHETVGQNAASVLRVESRNDPLRGYPGGEGRTRLSAVGCRLSAIHQSPAPSSQRRGITLTEVLISLGILTIGLLGVAAIFPVGTYYMQKGDISDRGSQIAQAAFNDTIARGWLNPARWLVWEDSAKVTTGVVPAMSDPASAGSSFTRPFAVMLRKQKAMQATSANPTDKKQLDTTGEFGSVFVIDPAGVASITVIDESTRAVEPGAGNTPMRFSGVFPSPSFRTFTGNVPKTSPWYPWFDGVTTNLGWPVRRVTLRQPGPPTATLLQPIDAVSADRLFSSTDDLALDLPKEHDKPVQQLVTKGDLDLDGKNDDALSRQSRGDYSWFVMVAPTSAEARDALATDPSSYTYEISVVVFHKRPIAHSNPTTQAGNLNANSELLQKSERGVRAKILSTGLSGGEVLLERERLPSDTDGPFDNLKTGNWIMLCGPNPNSTNDRPLMTARWYRVLAIEGKGSRLNQYGATTPAPPATDLFDRRIVSLRGPQWPWSASTDPTYATLSNSLYVCIPTGAVAVHAKTIHLEGNSAFSGGAGGLGSTPPPGSGWGVF